MIIQTGLYSDKAFEIIKRLEHYVRVHGYYHMLPVNRAPDNEVIIDIGSNDTDDCNFFNSRKSYVANKFKLMIKDVVADKDFNISSDLAITFDNIYEMYSDDIVYESIDCNVKDLVFIFSKLANQRRAIKNSNDFEHLIGVPNDPIQTALEIGRRKKVDEIIEKYSKVIREMKNTIVKKIEKLNDEMYFEEKRLIKQRDELIQNLKLVT